MKGWKGKGGGRGSGRRGGKGGEEGGEEDRRSGGGREDFSRMCHIQIMCKF